MDMAFHPSADLIATSLITGEIKVTAYDRPGADAGASAPSSREVLAVSHHNGACRSLAYGPSGRTIFSGASDCSLVATDAETGKVSWRHDKAHAAAVNVVFSLASDAAAGGEEDAGSAFRGRIATGDEDGVVKLWDVRQKECTHTDDTSTDYVSAMARGAAGKNHLLFTTGDGRLCVMNLRKGKVQFRSDDQEDELLSIAVIKGGKKVVCGSQEGVLVVWTYGQWADRSDGFPGHPQSIEALLKVDEDTLATGSSDGIIRAVSVQPNRLLGVLGAHDDFPVEQLRFSRDRGMIASCSHDSTVRLWDASMLFDEEEGAEDAEGETPRAAGPPTEAEAARKRKAEPSDSDGSDDSDEDGDSGKARRQRRRREEKRAAKKKKLAPKDARKLRPNSMAGFFADL
jgi:WD40 repeat protein